MKYVLRVGALMAVAVWLATVTAAAQPRPFTLSDVVSFKTIAGVSVSPDNRTAVFGVRGLGPGENRLETKLWSVGLDGSAPPRQITFGDGSDSSPKWSPDGRRLAFISERGGARQVWLMSIQAGEAWRVTAHPQPVSAFEWAPDGKRMLIVSRAPETAADAQRKKDKDDGYLVGKQWQNDRLWVIEIRDGEGGPFAPLTDGTRHVRTAAWSPDGSRIGFVSTPTPEADSSEDASLQLLDVGSRAVRDVPGGALASSPVWSPDGRSLAFTRPFDGNGLSRADAFIWTLAAGAPRNVSSALDRDIEGLRWTADGRALHVVFSLGAVNALARIDALAAQDAPRVERIWDPGYTFATLTPAGDAVVFVRSDRPAELWRAVLPPAGPENTDNKEHKAAHDARPITTLNNWAGSVQLATAERVQWSGPAGPIEGILTKPYGYVASRRYPLIVNPHGGPRGVSSLDFDPQACYFASLGYLVLKPNFRGSTGYGDAFTKGNIASWGDGPFRDVMAGVDHLVATGLADPDRLFIYGWSYGGYLTNWAITHTDRFRAAASGAGVADLRMQYTISDARRWRFDYFTGSPFTGNQAMYEKESPVTYARNARVPTLFVHGQDDVRCPLEQGLMMHRALRDQGIETELLVYPREGHGFTELAHIQDRLKRVADWFKKYDRAAPATNTGR